MQMASRLRSIGHGRQDGADRRGRRVGLGPCIDDGGVFLRDIDCSALSAVPKWCAFRTGFFAFMVRFPHWRIFLS